MILVAVTIDTHNRIIIKMTVFRAKTLELPKIMRILDNLQTKMNQERNLTTCSSKLRSQDLRSIRRTQSYQPSSLKRSPESTTQNQYYKF